MILIFIVFSLQIGAKKATFLSVMPAGIAALWTIGVFTLLYHELSILTFLAPIFTIIIGSADGFHYMSHYLDKIEEGASPVETVSETLKMEKIQEINGGAIPLEVFIKTDNDIYSLNIAKKVFQLENELKDKGLITKSFSIYNIISKYNSLGGISFLQNPEKILDKLEKQSTFNYEKFYPQNSIKLSFIKNFIKTSFSEKHLSSLIIEEKKVARVFIFPVDYSNNTLGNVKNIINKYKTKNLIIETTSIQYLMKDLNGQIKKNQLNSVILITLFIFIILIIYFKRFKEAVLSTIPVFMSLITVIGFIGYANVSFSVVTSIMMGITIGVGIDYAIHFTSVYIHFKKEKFSSEAASKKAFDFTSTPIVANAMGLAIRLTGMVVSPFIIHVYLTEIMWIGMMTSSLFTLGFLSFIFRKI